MNREDTIWSPEDLERFFANFVTAEERDECARARRILGTTINERGQEDYYALLEGVDSGTLYHIRGYGDTPGKAADNAYAKWLEDPEVHAEYSEVWEE